MKPKRKTKFVPYPPNYGEEVFKKIFASAAFLSMGAFLLAPILLPCSCSQKHTVHIGKQPSLASGERAAIRALSHEMKTCRAPSSRGIEWTLHSKDDCRISYSKDHLVLILRSDDRSATRHWRGVSEEDIHAVAAKNGRIKDLESYGAYQD